MIAKKNCSHYRRGLWAGIYLIDLLGFLAQIIRSLLIGNDLNVIGGLGKSECNGVPVANIDLIYVDLVAAVHTTGLHTSVGWKTSIAAHAVSRILILLYQQIVGGNRIYSRTNGQSPIISNIQDIHINICIIRESQG